MNVELLKRIIYHSKSLDPNDDFEQEKCWKEMTDILSNDVPSAIHFLENECTEEEFYWLSPVFEDVAEKTQSKEFIQALRDRLAKTNPETYCQQHFESEFMRKWIDYPEYIRSIEQEINYAEGKIGE